MAESLSISLPDEAASEHSIEVALVNLARCVCDAPHKYGVPNYRGIARIAHDYLRERFCGREKLLEYIDVTSQVNLIAYIKLAEMHYFKRCESQRELVVSCVDLQQCCTATNSSVRDFYYRPSTSARAAPSTPCCPDVERLAAGACNQIKSIDRWSDAISLIVFCIGNAQSVRSLTGSERFDLVDAAVKLALERFLPGRFCATALVIYEVVGKTLVRLLVRMAATTMSEISKKYCSGCL